MYNYKVRKANDEKFAVKIKAEFPGVIEAYGDDGNLHVKCANRTVAEVVQEQYGRQIISDGVQEGSVVIGSAKS